MNAHAGEAPELVEGIENLLQVDEFDFPRAILLRDDALQGYGGVAVTATRIVEDDLDLFSRDYCAIRFLFARKSTLHAMWITKEVLCAQ